MTAPRPATAAGIPILARFRLYARHETHAPLMPPELAALRTPRC